MTKIIWIISIQTLICTKVHSQKIDTTCGKHQFYSNYIPFTLLKIVNERITNSKIPIILFLHGAGERGTDNRKNLEIAIPTLVNSITKSKKSCYILAPQCPENDKWVKTDWKRESHKTDSIINWPLKYAVLILDSLLTTNNSIDKTKIYLIGISMGGFGTWELIERFPNKFAAAIPVCGGGDTSNTEAFRSTPIWAFHGRKDNLVKVSRTIDMIRSINKDINKAKITIFENDGHLFWDNVFKNEKVKNWLFLNKK
jgi:predicted peptidase